MIVGFNARILNTKAIRGWSRYTYNLLLELQRHGVDLRLFSDQPLNLQWVPKELRDKVFVHSGKSYIHWEQIVLKDMAEKEKVDILHCPTNYGLPLFGNFKKILTLHDAIEKSFYRNSMSISEKLNFTQLKLNMYYLISRRAADKIITVSHSAKEDIVKSYKVSQDKVDVIYEAADEFFSETNVKNENEFAQRWKVTPGYLLYIGGFEERKNIEYIFEMAKRLPYYQFVLVGGGDIDRFGSISGNIHFTGYVEDSWLPSFYKYSKALLYPSFHEGFGLQIVEAMALDKPCLHSNTTSLPEIYGSREWGFDPQNVGDGIVAVHHLEENYDDAVKHVQERKGEFSWQKTAKETMELYHSLLR